jgi:hypothetical protein
MTHRSSGPGTEGKPLGIVVVEGSKTNGFGMNAQTIRAYEYVEVLTTEDFEERKSASKPTGFHQMGFNRGAPLDGLYERTLMGLRCLVDGRFADEVPVYADIASLSAAGVVMQAAAVR